MTGRAQIELAYGRSSFDFRFDENRFSVLTSDVDHKQPLSDFEIGAAFDDPIASPALDEIAGSNDSVLIVVSDATRATASAQVVNLLIRRLVQAGVSPANIAIIFATGIHRPVSEKETVDLLTAFVVQRVRVLQHDADDVAKMITLGQTGRIR